MRIMYDVCGWPAAELSSNKFISLYPLTVYHLERFIWETAPTGLDVRRVLGDDERPTPWHPEMPSVERLWATGLGWSTAEALAAWLGGRLPGRVEHVAARALWDARPSCSAGAARGDERARALAGRLLAARTPRSAVLPPWYGDFVTEFSESPFGGRLVLRHPGGMTVVTSEQGIDTPIDSAGMVVVFNPRKLVGPVEAGSDPKE